jgi:hypothetical protein
MPNRVGKTMKNQAYFLTIVRFVPTLLLYSSIAFAGLTPGEFIDIKADYLRYDDATDHIIASGNVEISGPSFNLKASRIIVDNQENIAKTSGNVRLVYNNMKIEAASLLFSLVSDDIVVNDYVGKTKMVSERSTGNVLVSGNVYFSSRRLQKKADHWHGQDFSGTSCDYPQAHYQADAASFRLYPGDRVEANWVVVHAGIIPLFATPYWVHHLGNTNYKIHFPQIGKNDIEGSFFKYQADFAYDKQSRLTVLFDSMSKKGTGIGLKNTLETRADHLDLSYYRNDEQDTGLLSHRADMLYRNKDDNTLVREASFLFRDRYLLSGGRENRNRVSLTHRLLPWFNQDSMVSIDNNLLSKTWTYSLLLKNKNELAQRTVGFSQFKNDLTHYSKIKGSYRYSEGSHSQLFTYQDIDSSSSESSKIVRLSVQGKVFDNSSIVGRINYNENNNSGQIENTLLPFIRLNTSLWSVPLSIESNLNIDLDADQVTSDDHINLMEKIPEVTIMPKPVSVLGISYSPRISLGRYRERQYISGINFIRDLNDTSRLLLKNNVNHRLGNDLISFSSNWSFDQYLYSSNDAQYRFNQDYGLSLSWLGMSNESKYTNAYIDGFSPFYFDQFQSSRRRIISNLVRYSYGKILNFTVNDRWDLELDKRSDEQFSLQITQGKELSLHSKTSYSFDRSQWNDFIQTIRINWGKHSFQSSIHYDIEQGKLNNSTARLQIETGDTWQEAVKIELSYLFDSLKTQHLFPAISIKKNLHCWEAIYKWNRSKEEHMLTFSLNLFKDERIGYSVDNKGSKLVGIDKLGKKQ